MRSVERIRQLFLVLIFLFAGCKLGDVSAPQRPGWIHAVETAVVEVYGNLGCRWFPI